MIAIPGKTFLVGEYAVLVGGEALGIATKPSFILTAENADYHSDSAAGLFCAINDIQFNSKVNNPYGMGGFGQSTAEFIFAWFKKNKKINSLTEIFNQYLNLYNSEKLINLKPSGADLVTQIMGQITHFSNPVGKSKSVIWPFSELSFFVISTGLKIQTHEHLRQLDRNQFSELPALSQNVIKAFFSENESVFLNELKRWSEKLNNLSLQHKDVLKIKNELELFPKIKFVKPCGAMGADVCLVFCAKFDKHEVKNYLLSREIKIQSDETQLAKGLL